MPISDYLNYILVASIVSGCFSLYFLFSFVGRIKKVKLLSSVRKLFGLLIFSFITVSLSFLLLGIQGYQMLTSEILVAKVSIIPKSRQHFVAVVQFEDKPEQFFQLAGDEVMFEANVLKWKSWSTILGLKTAYRLDRIRGRYYKIEDEKNKPLTLYSLVEGDGLNIAEWRENYQHLSFLLDVEHGSASFASAEGKKTFELMMTTSGLLLRPITELE